MKIKEVGIRPGEKIHEEMISSEEWLRTENHDENYLITQENEFFQPGQPSTIGVDAPIEMYSYSSKDDLMDLEETMKFLKETGVI